jgi:hypothetical protein
MPRGRVLRMLGIAIRTIPTGCAMAFCIWIGMSGCATEVPSVMSAPPSVEEALIGKTEQELLACTAVSPSERTLGDVTQLMFYKEATLLEESFPISKGSVSQPHHGCLAHVQLREGRLDSVHYHAVPPSDAGYDHCDEIFETCLGH